METIAKTPARTEARSGRKTKPLAAVRTISGSLSAGAPRRERAKLPEEVKDSTLHLRLREGLKQDATSVLADIGISVPEAIRVFLGRIVSEGKLPFELEIPNAITRRAMEEARRLDGGRYASAKELFDDLDNGGAR